MKKTLAIVLTLLLAFGLCIPMGTAATDFSFTLNQPSGKVGDTVKVEIALQSNFSGKGGLVSFQFELIYDTAALQLQSIEEGKAADAFTAFFNPAEPVFAGAASSGTKASGVLYYVSFKIIGEGGGFLLLKDIQCVAMDAEGNMNYTMTDLESIESAVTVPGEPVPTVDPGAFSTPEPGRTPGPAITPDPQEPGQPDDLTPAPEQTEEPTDVTAPPIDSEWGTPPPMDNEADTPPLWFWLGIIGLVVVAGIITTILLVSKRKKQQP